MRSPYEHELNSCGTDCADNCPACRWARDRMIAQLEAEPDVAELERMFALETPKPSVLARLASYVKLALFPAGDARKR
jgi:hypothetical protein